MKRSIILSLLFGVSILSQSLAEVPRTISYQGVLKDEQGWTVPDGDYDMTFRMYDSPEGQDFLWEETQIIPVSDGVFNAILGAGNPLDLSFEQAYWLGISIMADPELEPRIQLTASPYSLRAAVADSVIGTAVSDGDWFIVGDDMFSGVEGNVGVGTTEPYSRLDVRGTGPDDGGILSLGNSDRSHFLTLFPGRENDPNPFVSWKAGDPLRFSTDEGGWSEKMRITSDGRVGIGEQDPAENLDVAGTIETDGFRMPTEAQPGYVLTSDINGFGSWQPGGTGGMPPGASGQTLRHNGTSWTATSLLYNNGVRVAVGTTSPTRLFDVEAVGGGPGGAQARVKEYSNNWDGPVLQLGKSRANLLGQNLTTQVGDTLGVIDGFGIDMSGAEQVGARVVFVQPGEGIPPFVPGSIAFQTSDGVTVPMERMIITSGGDVGIGVSPSRMFDVGGNTLVRGNLDVQGDTNLQGKLDVNGAAAFGDTLDLGGNRITRVATPAKAGDAATKGYVDAAVQISGGLTGTGTARYIPRYASADSLTNSVIYEKSGGLVGIATTAVKNRLDVEGAMAVGNGYSGMFTAPANGMIIEGNVGIGTDTAGSRLEIEGSGNTAATSALHVKDTNGNSLLFVRDDGAVGVGTTTMTTPYCLLKINGGLEVNDFIKTANSAGLPFQTASGATGLFIDPNAKVGVGTYLPKNRLDVQGAAAIGASYSGTNTAPDNSLIVQSKVGIGTPSPDYTLDVAGSAGFNDFLYHNGDTDTYISFQNDEMALFAAGSKLVHVDGSGSYQVLINDDGLDVDFRIESDIDANALFVRGSDGRVGIGTSSPGKELDVDGTTRTKVLEITGGSDLAEPFEISDGGLLEAGTVVVIDDQNPGKLRMSGRPYDKRVAGIISGAGGVRPGLTLNQEGMFEQGRNVALTGRVWCKADASYGSIEPGDRLTTSSTPGHAMSVTDQAQAPGAVIGKAMTSLSAGRGLVLVLVQPQ